MLFFTTFTELHYKFNCSHSGKIKLGYCDKWLNVKIVNCGQRFVVFLSTVCGNLEKIADEALKIIAKGAVETSTSEQPASRLWSNSDANFNFYH